MKNLTQIINAGKPLELAMDSRHIATQTKEQIETYAKLEEFTIVVANTKLPTRTKSLNYGLDFVRGVAEVPSKTNPWFSGLWGRKPTTIQQWRVGQYSTLMELLKAETDKTQGKMPVVRVMAINRKDLKLK